MALSRRVIKDDNILCELYAATYSDVSVDSESEIVESNSVTSPQLVATCPLSINRFDFIWQAWHL
jgi:hypothetical protein